MIKRLLYLIFIVVILLSCENKQNYTVKEEFRENYIKNGSEITASAFNQLSSKLKNAITHGGFEGAVEYCNLNVNQLMNSLEKDLKVKISRVSDKNRNPNNKANDEELIIIEEYKQDIKDNLKLFPTLRANDKDVIYYSPIRVLSLCLNCHGDGNSQINKETLNAINEKYPEDKATGYKIDEIRGLWKIVFENQKESIKIDK